MVILPMYGTCIIYNYWMPPFHLIPASFVEEISDGGHLALRVCSFFLTLQNPKPPLMNSLNSCFSTVNVLLFTNHFYYHVWIVIKGQYHRNMTGCNFMKETVRSFVCLLLNHRNMTKCWSWWTDWWVRLCQTCLLLSLIKTGFTV